MTEQECIKWVQENLPFAMRSKKGKLQYPFKAAYYAREIEQHLGKSLYKLLAGQKGSEREFIEWMIFGEGNELYSDYETKQFYQFEFTDDGTEHLVNPRTLDELHEYWKIEVKGK